MGLVLNEKDDSVFGVRCISDLVPGRTRLPLSRGQRVRRFGGEGSAEQITFDFHKDAEKLEPYSPGDPTGFIHWPAFARTDNLLVKKKRPEIQKLVRIYFDCTASMDWPNEAALDVIAKGLHPQVQNQPSAKMKTAWQLVLDLCLRHLFCGDKVELEIKAGGELYKFRLGARAHGRLLFAATWPWSGQAPFLDSIRSLESRIPWAGQRIKKIDKEYIVQDFLNPILPIDADTTAAASCSIIGIGSQLEFDRSWADKLSQKAVLTPGDQVSKKIEKHARSALQSEELEANLQAWVQKQEEQAKNIGARFHCLHEATPLSLYAVLFGKEEMLAGG